MLKQENIKKSLILVLSVGALLAFLVFLFRGKIEEMLSQEVETSLMHSVQQDAALYESNLEKALTALSTYAEMIDGDNESIKSFVFKMESKKENLGFSKIGIVNLEGEGIWGTDVDLQVHPVLRNAFRGVPSYDYEKNGLLKGLVFAVPIYNNRNVRFVLYGIMNEKDRSVFSIEENQGVLFAADTAGNLVIPATNKAYFKAFWDSVYKIIYKKVATRDTIFKELSLYKVCVRRISLEKGSVSYVSCALMSNGKWVSISIMPENAVRNRVATIMHLLLLVFGALITLFVIIFYYIQAMERRTKKKMFELAYVDPLTGLYNWPYLKEQIQKKLSRTDIPLKKEFGFKDYLLAKFDIIDFKAINEVFGFNRGNILLKLIAKHLREEKAWIILSAREENDSFFALLPPMSNAEASEKLIHLFERIRQEFQEGKVKVNFRCGVTSFSNANFDVEIIADAVRTAKKQIRTSLFGLDILFYDEKLKNDLKFKKQIKADLPEAIKNGELQVFLQPKVNTISETLAGAEALVRWNYRREKFLQPNSFIPIFEEDGSIEQIDNFVLETVCKKFKEWEQKKYPLLPISVNVSRVQLNNLNLVQELNEMVTSKEINISLIDLELTETASYGDNRHLIETMRDIKHCGFKLSMDDFGTGYSSLSLLKNMPLDILKLDKSFVDDLGCESENKTEAAIVKTIIDLARQLEIKCLAEGVETKEQRDILAEFGCDYIQGFYYSKPISIKEYENLLLKNKGVMVKR
ncbi:MAG: bifunctional diguanylate cyclase/phosphodiesterase [Fibrobacteraceae bacterium]|nr:bifunctional diguanylate cyclase/phosphodiesterase [Fibrobacteraceae bacterium]